MSNPSTIEADKMADIQSAGDQRLLLNIGYTDAKGRTSMRIVEPYEIRGDSLFAFCLSKHQIRHFKIANISMTQLSKIHFNPRFPISM